MSIERTREQFAALLAAEGAEAAIAYLNTGVPHRYTAAFRLDGDVLTNLLLHDKLGEARPEAFERIPFTHSFCQFVLRDGKFRTDDTTAERELDGHPYQGVLMSYHGVPLVTDVGVLLGTLCHFDVESLGLSDDEFELLQAAGQILPTSLTPAI